MRLTGKPMHRLNHPIEKERFGVVLTAMPVGCRHQFFHLWYGKGYEETGKDWLERMTKPMQKKSDRSA